MRPTLSALATATALLVLGLNPVQAAKYYKWVDENGVTQFTERKPASGYVGGVEEHNVNVTGIRSQTGGSDPGQSDDERARLCEQSREYLARIQGSDIFRTNAQGVTAKLTDEEKQTEVNKAQSQVDQFCSQ